MIPFEERNDGAAVRLGENAQSAVPKAPRDRKGPVGGSVIDEDHLGARPGL